MANVTFQVLEGVDKGRIFRDLPTPVTIGREEGNLLRLNDERVSRFHAKIQQDDEDIILTDLESTNGTRVNGTVVQIRRLRFGDRVTVGRTMLLYGTTDEIISRMARDDDMDKTFSEMSNGNGDGDGDELDDGPKTVQSPTFEGHIDDNLEFDLNLEHDKHTITPDVFYIGNRALPPLPLKLTPSQAARLSEILDYIHAGLIRATEEIEAKEDGTDVTLKFDNWQRILAAQMVLARYVRAIVEPESLDEEDSGES